MQKAAGSGLMRDQLVSDVLFQTLSRTIRKSQVERLSQGSAPRQTQHNRLALRYVCSSGLPFLGSSSAAGTPIFEDQANRSQKII